MEIKDIKDELKKLIHLDIDAVHAYDMAIKEIDFVEIRSRLTAFKQDHERHVSDLSVELSSLGEMPPKLSPDFKGYLIKGFTALRSKMGTEQALEAMRSNEQLTNKNYKEAMKKDFPQNIKELISRNFSDEQRHFAYIERTLAERPWEGPGAQP